MKFAYASWVRSLDDLLDRAEDLLPSQFASIEEAVDRLQSRVATVTFGGRFKSGKSTLVNAALGRPLLPTRDLPETGANCYLMAGPVDSAVLIQGTRQRPIACTTASLRNAISLRGGTDPKPRLDQIDRVDVRLADFPGGKFCRWIDPPGMFDRPEMNDRAWKSARAADILVWVIRSQQFLDESDVAALRQFVAERGPASLAFVENAFLPKDSGDAWAYHRRAITPVNRDKLRSLAVEMGVSPEVGSSLVVASAKQILASGSGFGRDEMIAMLRSFSGPDSPRVRLSRLQFAMLTFRSAAKVARAELDEIARRNLDRQLQADSDDQKAKQARTKFALAVQRNLTDYQERFRQHAEACADVLAANLTTSNLKRDSSYSHALNYHLSMQADDLIGRLLILLNQEATRLGLPTIENSLWASVRPMLCPPAIHVAVPDRAMKPGGMAGGVAAGAAIGSVVPILGTIAGGVIGGIFGTVYENNAAMEADAAGVRQNIRFAADRAIDHVRMASAQVGAWIEIPCVSTRTVDPAHQADLQRELALEELSRELEEAADRTVDLARQESVP